MGAWTLALRVQAATNHILSRKLYYSYDYPMLKYLIIGYLDPLGWGHLNLQCLCGYMEPLYEANLRDDM